MNDNTAIVVLIVADLAAIVALVIAGHPDVATLLAIPLVWLGMALFS